MAKVLIEFYVKESPFTIMVGVYPPQGMGWILGYSHSWTHAFQMWMTHVKDYHQIKVRSQAASRANYETDAISS